jgi:hypothetical protein
MCQPDTIAPSRECKSLGEAGLSGRPLFACYLPLLGRSPRRPDFFGSLGIESVMALQAMSKTAIALLSFCDMACSLTLAPLCQLLSPAGLKHGRTIPSAGMS